MGKYTGSQCIICQNRFTDDDDIVVCPDCGTPYHRDCWAKQGHCINSSLHAVGASWNSIRQEQRLRAGGKVCPHCEYVNAPDAKKCESCGGPFETREESSERIRIPLPGGANAYFEADDPCCGLPPDEKMEEERLGDVAEFVRSNTLYYIPLFRRFRDTGRTISLNLSAALFPHLYFAYRKMWVWALVSCLVLIVCGLPGMLLNMLTTLTTQDFMNNLSDLYGLDATEMFANLTAFLQAHERLLNDLNVPMYLVGIAIRLMFCLFGNHLYYRFALRKVGRIRTHAPNAAIRRKLLQVEGGTSFWNIVGCIAVYYGGVTAVSMILTFLFIR